jgi:chemotaxis protein CheD
MSTRDKLTLTERMEQARARTVAARHAPQPAPPGGHKAAAEHRPPGHGHAGHHGHGHHGHKAAHGSAPRSAPAGSSAAVANAWQVQARPGDHLVLMPGQMHFGPHAASLRTLLGSCVAVTLWHPQKRIGGMCHFLLPSRPRRPDEAADGRYGDEAIDAMVAQLRLARTEPAEYHAHLYGGADTMPEGTNLKFNVGERNIEQGWGLIDRWGFQLQGVDVGEDVPRTVTLTLATGDVEMRRGIGKAPPLQINPGPGLPGPRKHHG